MHARAALTVVAGAVSVGVLMMALGCPDVRSPPAGVPDAAGLHAWLVVPPEGTPAPTNLRRIVVAADADPGALSMPNAHAGPTPACEAAWCGELDLDAPLEAHSTVQIQVGKNVLSMTVGADSDRTPPRLIVDSLLAEGACAHLQLYTDEPTTISLRDTHGTPIAVRDVASLSHELAAQAPDGPSLVVLASDLAGNFGGARLDWTPAPNLPPLVITEVMAHPLGAQPAQEWVEIENRGTQAVTTSGLSIAAAGGSDPLPTALIPPGGFAVVAGAGFSANDGTDVPPAPGALLLRLNSPTVGDGLSNAAGAAVELRDAAGHVISRYGGWVDASPRSAAGKSAVRASETACDARAAWRLSAHPTPGAPNLP
jgi:lamin tail-like protein